MRPTSERSRSRAVLLLALATAIAGAMLTAPLAAQVGGESSFGRYSGYGEALYDGRSLRSEYVTMPDSVIDPR